MLTDEAKIYVKAGKGGDGAVSFRREKFVPKGGPDGGDGGNGGNVYLVCKRDLNSLTEYARKKDWRAQNGENGRAKKQAGKSGEDLEITVPPGTIVKAFNMGADTEAFTHDFVNEGDKLKVAQGGKGGRGNVHFATPTRQAPFFAEKGTKGEEKILRLELKLIADVGLIGLPNAGKSTLLSRISNARPKIANYPFTTIEPNLGVVKFQDKTFVVADIPGLIEGASAGKGLGDKFLKHIERTKVLVHLIDINSEDPAKDYEVIRKELAAWSQSLADKDEIIAMNKADSFLPEEAEKIARKLSKDIKRPVVLISAVAGKGIDELVSALVDRPQK